MLERISFILLINIIFFAKSLCYKYSSDDIPVFQASQKLKYTGWKKRYHQLIATIRVKPQEDHAITTFLHAITSALIYTAFGANDISFTAALLFSFNPIHNQGSVWISGRGYVIPTLLLLLTITCPYLSPLTIFAMMYFNIGYVASIILVFINPLYLILIIIAGLIHYKRIKENIKQKFYVESFAEDRKIKISKLIIAIKTFGFYITHAIIPIKTTFYHSYMQSMAGAGKERSYKEDRFFVIGYIAILGILINLIYVGWNTQTLGLVWWCIGILPFLNLYRISQEIAERYTYLPLAGLMVAFATIIHGHPVIIASVIAVYATKMWFYMDCYQDDYYLSEYACLYSPDAWFSWHVRALRRWEVKSYNEAIIFWTMAKMISPKEFKILFNLATILKICKLDKEAEQYLNEAMKNVPEGQEAYSNNLFKNWKKGELAVLI